MVGNWKMNPGSPEKAKEIFSGVSRKAVSFGKVCVVMCPPSVFLSLFKKPKAKNVFLGAQDVFWEQAGSHTGEIGPLQVKEAGGTYVILGHSERRALGETDTDVSKKVGASLRAGLSPIVCVGEKERDSSVSYFEFLKNQIKGSLAGLRSSDLESIIIAYEPVWAIGKSFKDAMKPSDVHEMSLFIKKVLSDLYTKEIGLVVPILYGGSVNFENGEAIFTGGQVQGFLVGRESLDPLNFIKLISVVNGL